MVLSCALSTQDMQPVHYQQWLQHAEPCIMTGFLNNTIWTTVPHVSTRISNPFPVGGTTLERILRLAGLVWIHQVQARAWQTAA